MKPGKNIQHPASRLHHNNSEQVKVFVLALTEGSQNSNGGGWYYKPKHLTFVLVPISAHKLSYIFFFLVNWNKPSSHFVFKCRQSNTTCFQCCLLKLQTEKKTPRSDFWFSSGSESDCLLGVGSSCRTSEFCLQLEQKARSALCVQVYFTHRACSDWKRRWKTTLICTTSVSQSVCMCVWVCVMGLISRSVNHTQALLKPMISTDQG